MTHYTCQLSWWVNFLSPTNYRVIVTKILIGLVVGDIILACFDQKVMNDVLVLRTSMHGMAMSTFCFFSNKKEKYQQTQNTQNYFHIYVT